MKKILVFLSENWIRFLIALMIGAVLMIIYNAVQNTWHLLRGYLDGFFISGMVLIGFSLLVLMSLFGAYDIFSFYFARKQKEEGGKENYYEYSERRRLEKVGKKLIFLPYLIIGVIYLSVSFIIFAFI